MGFQTIAVTVLVGLSFVYATQALMPTAWRVRVLAVRLPCVTDRLRKTAKNRVLVDLRWLRPAQAKAIGLRVLCLESNSFLLRDYR